LTKTKPLEDHNKGEILLQKERAVQEMADNKLPVVKVRPCQDQRKYRCTTRREARGRFEEYLLYHGVPERSSSGLCWSLPLLSSCHRDGTCTEYTHKFVTFVWARIIIFAQPCTSSIVTAYTCNHLLAKLLQTFSDLIPVSGLEYKE